MRWEETGSKVRTCHHEDLDRVDDEDVVHVEARVRVVEREEAVDGQLCSKVVVLARELLFTHTGADLRLEVQDGAKSKITSLAALVVLRVLDASTAAERVHTGEDILVEMQALLRLGHTAARRHERRVQEIGVTVVQLAADPRERPGGQRTERLFLSSRQVTKDTDVL